MLIWCIKGVFQLKQFKLRTDFIITCAQFEGFVLSPSQFFAIVKKVRQNVMNRPLQFDRLIKKQTMTDTPPHQPHVPSNNANKTADALRDVPVVLRRRIQPPPSRNEVVVGLNDWFDSLDQASDQTHQESPHQCHSTPKNTNKTTDALGDETASKGGQIQPPPPPKEAVMVPNLPASPNPSSLLNQKNEQWPIHHPINPTAHPAMLTRPQMPYAMCP